MFYGIKGKNRQDRPLRKLSVLFLTFFLSFSAKVLYGQSLVKPAIKTSNGIDVSSFTLKNGTSYPLKKALPLFTMILNGHLVTSGESSVVSQWDGIHFSFSDGIDGTITQVKNFDRGWKAVITFVNTSRNPITIQNLVPFGQSKNHIYITASGPPSLARTKLFRPGKSPVGVVLPDNAWAMGYSSFPLHDSLSVVSITMRSKSTGADVGRWKVKLKPSGTLTYYMYADVYKGKWQNGLRLMFQKRYLYELNRFNNTLFERKDLQWIRHTYVIGLQMAWDHQFFDERHGGYHFQQYLNEGKKLFGGYGVYGIWPTWPRLGLDQQNQWQMYSNLPGGLKKLHQLVETAHRQGIRFFIEYNPWDKSTKKENPYKGMTKLLKAINADGVVLDTKASSSPQLQAAADSVKPGIIMYSEGMAVPKNMPGIVAGRVHNAIHMPPPLNLNKFIKPDFAIFRVCVLNDGYLHREFAVSFFNGYGSEINEFSAGRPAWSKSAFKYLGRTTMILRENSDNFLSQNWTPLIPSLQDSIWVNKWPGKNKMIYTIYSLRPSGFKGPLFKMASKPGTHFVDIWNHSELTPDTVQDKAYVPVNIKAFNKSWLGTRREGNVDCIARFPDLLTIKLDTISDTLQIAAPKADSLRIWAGKPSYQNRYIGLPVGKQSVSLYQMFGRYQGKFVIQLVKNNDLLDERVIHIKPGTPILISKIHRTRPASSAPQGMVYIPASTIKVHLKNNDNFIPYPYAGVTRTVHIRSFYIDKYPVTNEEYYRFIKDSHYRPKDMHNYLKNWHNGHFPQGMGKMPVVWVSLKDARAYAKWAGKRLPTEMEWQLAAQGTDARKWPWGAKFDSTRCNVGVGHLTPVNKYPKGASEYGVMDLVGNVWQMTNDVYDDGSYYFDMIRGGSYFNPSSSFWYVKGGPEPLDYQQMLLLVSPGFNRSATVGFRCVKDVK